MKIRKPKPWRKLDNNALLFVANNSKKDTKVFRFYCDLKEDIRPDKLQQALDKIIEIYPLFLTTLRRGLFWHYLEESDLHPKVVEEYKDPCAPLYIKDKFNLLFEVTYYKKRINFEVFHALTDGTGAMEFLRELIKQYLLLCHEKEGLQDIMLTKEKVTIQDQEDDAFSRYYTKTYKKSGQKKKKAYQVQRNAPSYKKLQITEHVLSLKDLLEKSRELGCSLSVLLTTIYICAIHEEMPKLQEKKPLVIMVPVNLRKFFASASMLNFFAFIEPEYNFSENSDDFMEILEAVKRYYKENLTEEKMLTHINKYFSLEKHPILRFFPLLIKNWGIYIGARKSKDDVTAIFSNMGAVVMPEEYCAYIESFGVYTNTPKVELTMCSFQDEVTLSFTSRFDTTNIKRNFYRILDSLSISAEEKESEFPESDTPELKGLMIYKWFSFFCILACVICLGINVLVTKNSWWSVIVIAGTGSFWMALSIGYYKRHNLLKDIMWLYILITCGSIVWDVYYGFLGWSVDYVFPAISIVVLIGMLIVSKIQAHSAKEYMIYFLMAASYSVVVSIVLMAVGIIKKLQFSVVSSSIGFLVVIVLMIFRWKDFKEELQKKFHL
ncbi:NRPS condensation-like uncharacterized protein [Aequitasia blattaphilus]|uniref:DUF6320 domain-containing protein n=1 Tax=Aequitasia blattaphilus TaxID=2949332 RepID=A0ABT1EEG7_9FIRM|nr:DUF6320 domain-containing protein [Aequitasia blattaphilus]MCP1102862.1 DUF6320 domain-containing protein [Aequitasia blattaphilus]MCR8615502.1 DUF6320 domain-containing protein [Aequitasia blattaphilus]